MSILSFPAIYCHGSDNRFILIDESIPNLHNLTNRQRSLLSQLLCDKKTGYLVDGLLFCNQQDFMDSFDVGGEYDSTMRMFNPDGSEAEMCGNGLRCAGRYSIVKNQQVKTRVATPKEILCVAQVDEVFPNILSFESEIGPISWCVKDMISDTDSKNQEGLSNQLLPMLDDILDSRIRYSALSIPNPHLIGISPIKLPQENIVKAWKLLSSNGMFPHGINLSIVNKLDNGRIFVITCERGVGPTNACGTAMAASSVVVAKYTDWVEKNARIEVFNLGGMVLCDVFTRINQNKVLVTGNASWIKELYIEVDLLKADLVFHVKDNFIQEQECYCALQAYVQQKCE